MEFCPSSLSIPKVLHEDIRRVFQVYYTTEVKFKEDPAVLHIQQVT